MIGHEKFGQNCVYDVCVCVCVCVCVFLVCLHLHVTPFESLKFKPLFVFQMHLPFTTKHWVLNLKLN